ncbi:UNVERIFIED_CONTAM: Histone deacetylase HDT1 [Sesamum latifolium]|uniref:Histone deacetylase HDT1 n=1 Tax=Sesamum latifolium TaxID=2727402 RepID=A0AAW2TZ77_9LAMI
MQSELGRRGRWSRVSRRARVGMGRKARRLEVERSGGGIGKAPSTGEQGEERGEAAATGARGVEVKSGEPLKVAPGDGMVLHLSQACLGELKKEKGNESVCMFVNVDGKKLVLGTLFSEKLPQQQFDLVFDRDFELSHNWKNGSVYFYGYRASNPFEEEYPLITISNFKDFIFVFDTL